MGSEIVRLNWGDGERTPNAVVPAVESGIVDPDTLPAPNELLRQMQGDVPATSDDPTAGLSASQIEAASYVATELLANAPSGFSDTFDTLSAGVQRKVFEVMAARGPNLRGLDLVYEVEKKLTLGEAAEAAEWLRALPEHHKAWLRGED